MFGVVTQLLLPRFSIKFPYFGEIPSPMFASSNVCVQSVGELTNKPLPNVHTLKACSTISYNR